MFLLTILMVRGNKRWFWGCICAFWLGGRKRGKRGGNYCLAHILVLDAEFFSWSLSGEGEEKKSRAMLCEPGLRDCLCKSKLASLFGRVWWITSPSGDSPAPTKGGRSSHSQYLSNQRGALHLMSAWDTLNGLRKEWFHRQAPVVMQNPGEMKRKVCTNGNCFYW